MSGPRPRSKGRHGHSKGEPHTLMQLERGAIGSAPAAGPRPLSMDAYGVLAGSPHLLPIVEGAAPAGGPQPLPTGEDAAPDD